MTDDPADSGSAHSTDSAGALLRAARERQGLHIAALAAAMKVPQAKLEALEGGRYDELTDATFARALAQGVCRVLKIDAKPVLERMPEVRTAVLDGVERSLRTPFRERPPGDEPVHLPLLQRPAFWLVLLLLVAAAGFALWPQVSELLSRVHTVVGGEPAPANAQPRRTDSSAPVAPDTGSVAAPQGALPTSPPQAAAPQPASVPAQAVPLIPPTAAALPADSRGEARNEPRNDTPAGIAVVRASEPSWVEALDARGRVLLSRTLLPDETVGLDGPLPIRLTIGNAPGTEVTLRGERVALGAPNRDNVVRVELR